jgi:hypothetical protein
MIDWHRFTHWHIRLAHSNLEYYIRWGNLCFLNGWIGNLEAALDTWRWGNEDSVLP